MIKKKNSKKACHSLLPKDSKNLKEKSLQESLIIIISIILKDMQDSRLNLRHLKISQ